MRELFDHKLTGLNEKIDLFTVDERGQGGAFHHYQIVVGDIGVIDIHFQNGPIKEFGINGLSQEVLLAIIIDRLRCFQAGQFACRENAIALTNCEEALMWLQKRTRDRLVRGVEGTNQH